MKKQNWLPKVTKFGNVCNSFSLTSFLSETRNMQSHVQWYVLVVIAPQDWGRRIGTLKLLWFTWWIPAHSGLHNETYLKKPKHTHTARIQNSFPIRPHSVTFDGHVPSLPWLLTRTNLFSVFTVLSLKECYSSGFKQHSVHGIWLFSTPLWHNSLWIHCSYACSFLILAFLSLSALLHRDAHTEGHLCYFQRLALRNKLLWTFVYVFMWM